MAKVTIEVYQILNTKSPAYGKYFGRVRQNSTIEPATLCKHAAMDSGIEEGEVAMVSDAVLKQVKELLINGHPIKVTGLGTFKLGISSEGVSSADVKKRHPEYDPSKDDIRKYLSAKQVKKAYILFTPCEAIKAQLRAVKVEIDKTEWAAQMALEKANNNT